MVAPFVAVPLVAGLGDRPAAAIALAAIVLAERPVLRVLQGASGRDLIPVLAATARAQLAFGLLFTIGLAVSA